MNIIKRLTIGDYALQISKFYLYIHLLHYFINHFTYSYKITLAT